MWMFEPEELDGGYVHADLGTNDELVLCRPLDLAGQVVLERFTADQEIAWSVVEDGAVRGCWVAANRSGLILRQGWTYPNDSDIHMWMRAYDSTGTVLWTRDEGEPAAHRFAIADDGGWASVGEWQGDHYALVVRKFSPAGELLWRREPDDVELPAVFSKDVAVDADGAVVAIATVLVDGVEHPWVRKYAP